MNKMTSIKLTRSIMACAIFTILLNAAHAETENEWIEKVVGAYSDYGSPSINEKMWEERARIQVSDMKDPNSTMHRFVTAEYAELQKIGSEVLKKPEAYYELTIMTATLLRAKNMPVENIDLVADQVAANINKFDKLFVTLQQRLALQQMLASGRELVGITKLQSQPNATSQLKETTRTMSAWTNFIKGDAKFSSLQALLGKPDGKEESQDNIQRYTTYRWWSKVDVGTTRAEDLKVKTVIAHGQPIIVGLENPSSGEEISFPWSDAAIWGRN